MESANQRCGWFGSMAILIWVLLCKYENVEFKCVVERLNSFALPPSPKNNECSFIHFSWYYDDFNISLDIDNQKQDILVVKMLIHAV